MSSDLKSHFGETGGIALIVAPDQKGLQNIFGMPAVRRAVLVSRALGFEEIHVIGNGSALRVDFQQALSDLVPAGRFHQVNGPEEISRVITGLSIPEEKAILALKASCVVDKATLNGLLEAYGRSGILFMQTKGNRSRERVYLTSGRYASPVLNDLWSDSARSRSFPVRTTMIGTLDGLPYELDGSEQGKDAAEAALVRSLALQTADSDGYLARQISRRVSRPISRVLAQYRVTPNQVTLLGAAIGLVAAVFFGLGGYWPPLFGSLLFLACIIIDGIDGEIARLKLKESPFGHKLDIYMDNVVHVAIFLGIAFGLYRASGGDQKFILTLFFLLGGFALCCLAVYQNILQRPLDDLRRSKLLHFMSLLSNRDFAYLLVLFALAGKLDWFLTATAAGAFFFALILWFIGRRAAR